MSRIAVLSDVHGNRWALEAVLEEIDRIGITRVVNLGDTVYGPLDPAGTAQILIERSYPTVCGNEDRIITEPGAPSTATLEFVRDQLQVSHLDWLRSLPAAADVWGARCFHGTPDSDSSYLLWQVDPAGARRRRMDEVERMAGDPPGTLILCGHDHVPGRLRLAGGRLVVNPGSVGLQAYRDDDPYPHSMETATPHARYSILEEAGLDWIVTDRTVPYDWEAAARAALRRGREDWAGWLRSGRA